MALNGEGVTIKDRDWPVELTKERLNFKKLGAKKHNLSKRLQCSYKTYFNVDDGFRR